MEYPKINSLWKRSEWYFEEGKKNCKDYQDGRQSFIIGNYADECFGNIKKWSVEEKVDGTNIRIIFENGSVRFGGRTKDAQIPCHLLDYLQENFTSSLMQSIFKNDDGSFPYVILFGEGYGQKIQSGGNYRKDPGFILFDVFVSRWWLQRESVKEIADKLNIQMVPQIGVMTEEEIIDFVKSKPLSRCSMNPQMMEGIIARPEPLMMKRNGQPIMFKLKCKEF